MQDLKAMNCDFMQGYYLSKTASAARAGELVEFTGQESALRPDEAGPAASWGQVLVSCELCRPLRVSSI